MKKEVTQYQRNINKWEKIRKKDAYFDTKVWETVEPYYEKATDRTTIKYTKYIRKHYITTELLVSREWVEEGDARPRLEKAGYLGSITLSSSGRSEKWNRESFDYVKNYK